MGKSVGKGAAAQYLRMEGEEKLSRAFVSENDAWEYCQKAREHCMMAERGKECKVQHCPYESNRKPSTVEQTKKEQDGALMKKQL